MAHIVYTSNVADVTIPTIASGIANSNTGHCAKTMFIIRSYVAEQLRRQQTMQDVQPWLLIVDDDTALSVSALLSVLSYYDPTEALVLGERYGFNLHTMHQNYSYITMGGGMVFEQWP